MEWRPRAWNTAADYLFNLSVDEHANFNEVKVESFVSALRQGCNIQVHSDGGFRRAHGASMAWVLTCWQNVRQQALGTGALLEVVPVSMAGGLGDPVGGGVTDGAASVGSGHVTTSSRGEMEGLTIEDLRGQVMEGSHDPEGAARELCRRSRRAVTLLI